MSGILQRVLNVIKGNAEQATDELEKNNPEAVFRMAIEAKNKDIKMLDDALREAMGNVFKYNQEAATLDAQVLENKKAIDLAIQQNKDDLGVELIQRNDALEKSKAEKLEKASMFKSEAEEVKGAIEQMKAELIRIKEESETAKTIVKTEDAMRRIRDIREGVSTDASGIALQNAREALNRASADRAARKEIDGDSTEAKIAELKKAASQSDAAARLAQMKAERASSSQ